MLIVTVCTMNICRSPAAAVLLGRVLTELPVRVVVDSAGTAAVAGVPRCSLSQALIGVNDPDGVSAPFTAELGVAADLILTADAGNRGGVISIEPTSRCKTFTVLEAARLAAWVTSEAGVIEVAQRKSVGQAVGLPADDLRRNTPPLPDNGEGRLGWLVEEMDAARGLAPVAVPMFGYLGLDSVGTEDIPDPHVIGFEHHRQSMMALEAGVAAVGKAMRQVALT